MHKIMIAFVLLIGLTTSPDEAASPIHTDEAPTVLLTPTIEHALWQQPAQQAPEERKLNRMISFMEMNGLSLVDTADKIIEKAGEPDAIVQDELLTDRTEYIYSHMTVGLSEGLVEFIATTAEVETMLLGSRAFQLDMELLIHELGEPDYIAEDGVVYVSGETCMKLFYKEDTKQLDSVHIFWLTSV